MFALIEIQKIHVFIWNITYWVVIFYRNCLGAQLKNKKEAYK